MKIRVGDRIKFKAETRQGLQTGTRKVVGFFAKNPMVRFRGYSNFVVYRREIIEVLKDEN